MKMPSLIPVGRERNAFAQPFASLQREIDRLFEDFTKGFPSFAASNAGNGGSLVPTTDVTETDKDIEITAELPGIEEKDVQVNFADGVLTIRGEKKAEKEEKDKNYRLVERSYGSFERSITLPEGVKPEEVKATIAKGVLTVKVPKPAPAQAKKIEVKSAA
jgi:HSP20 family protein